MGRPLSEGHFADFAVIWDEDHDVRVIEPIEEIYHRGLLSSFLVFGEQRGVFNAILSNRALVEAPFDVALFTRIDELEFSVRSANCLKNDDIVYIGDLVQKTEGEMIRTPNFGRNSLNEVKAVLTGMGLHFGMEVPGWAEHIRNAAKDKRRVGFLRTVIDAICQSLEDPWSSNVGTLRSGGNSIIIDEDEKVRLYLRNLEMLWQLGTVERQGSRNVGLLVAPN
jgi:hypothetical protein